MSKKILLAIFAFSSFWACNKDETPTKDLVIGKNNCTTIVDGDTREYIVNVPTIYNDADPTPVVFMLHGLKQSGERFYDISGWKELGDTENIITVFPTALRFCFTQSGQQFLSETIWNTYNEEFVYCDNEVPSDDIKFLRQIISELELSLNIDSKKIYMVGFSNGGHMTFRCAVEMSDILAATVLSGGAYGGNKIFTPLRDLPITLQVGNSDNGWFDNFNVPLNHFDSLINNLPLFQRIVKTTTNTFHFDSTYTMSVIPDTAAIATFKGIPDIGNRVFQIILIDGLEHKYPNGNNHPINGAVQNWEWMKQYSIE